MEPKCHGDDLCTLQELSDSTLLSCLESRYRKNIYNAHIGRNVSLFLSPSPHTIPAHANRLAAAILHDLCTQADDQCLLLYGKSEQKTAIFQGVLASLLSQAHSDLTDPLIAAVQLLSLLTSCKGIINCVLASSLYVDPTSMKSTGAHFSCMLLNTTSLHKFKVFTHLELVGVFLDEVGMPLQLKDNYMALLNSVRLLLAGEEASGCLGVQLSTNSGLVLAQQLYTYLVAWTVGWLNSELVPPPTETPCRVLCVSHPSKWTDTHHDSLPDLIARYCSESLYNLLYQRLFVWEQEQYLEEGIEWETVPVELNQTLLDTFHKADGLLYSVGLDSCERILPALTSCCESSGDTCYEMDSDTFVVSHFTGEQSYVLTEKWPTLNTLHSVSPDLTSLFSTSSNQLLCDISKMMMQSSPDILPFDHPPSGHTHSLTSRAKECMSAVCEEVTTCHPHFVLALSVNNGQEDKDISFDPAHLLTQLQHLRLLDMALIQSCGYPVRLSHDKFISSYSSLLISEDPAQSPVETCRALIATAQLDDCVIGSHQVLMKPWHIHQLEDAISVFQTSARKLQQAFQRSYSRRNSDRMRMERAFSMVRQSNLSEDSGEDECSPPSSVTSPIRNIGSPDYHMTESDEPSSLPDVMESPISTIPPNVPASQPRPPLPARPHLSPPQKSPSQASPALPKSPAKSGHTGPKKRSWGKDVRHSSPHAFAAPSPRQEDHTSFNWYHGMISRSDAEKALRSVKCDCFLIRESQNRGGEHSLSLTHKGKVKHFRIDTKPGNKIRFELFGAKRSFLRLSDLVEYYSQYCLSADGELLVTPLPKEGTSEDCPPPLPPPRRSNLSSIKRPQKSIRKLHDRPKPTRRSTESAINQDSVHPPSLGQQTRPQSVDLYTADISDESIVLLQKELDIEERIMEAARRLADMPCNKREKQRRKQSVVEARSRLLMLRQQYHTVQERRRFIEMSMQNIVSPTRRISEPLPPLPPPRGTH